MSIIQIEGNVTYRITLDPGVWIFDDRKIELSKAFLSKNHNDTEDKTMRAFTDAWDRETSMAAPPVQKSIKTFEREKLITESYCIPFLPFLSNATPLDKASKLVIETSQKETVVIPLQQAKEALLGFSKDGKPLKEDGPIHFYYGDGSNKDNPIKNVKKLIVK